ncbi:hypothetical protein NEOLI_004758 [Neolecta irregularis DAH-3]|uniref:Bud3 C-terminal PH domain-containing protein n=1 Tax=Neolecta irregularis (strain DAH-3) TaxID=1198029 RepID=A0A1U7LIV2_NEOID|nr:hypothetical protein NEOLI_004758 [Neolecta irregularis DAH-3]|eukprot:OLL22523.1 hypothetical protein NEOLI_004758 [Neolecta irregularis DAH-3]
MERKDAEKVSSTFFALKNKIAGFPDSMISANRRLVNAVNAQCLLSPDFLRAESLPVTLVIFTDCIAILQRVGETVSGAAEILQCRFLLKPQGSRKTEKSNNLATSTSNKKDLIFRGWIKWEQAYFEYGHQQDSLWIRLSSEVVNSVVDHDNRWTRKPERKFIISGETNIDVEGFMQAITSAKLQCKTGKAETLTLNNHSLSAKFAVYRGTEQYKSEDVKVRQSCS